MSTELNISQKLTSHIISLASDYPATLHIATSVLEGQVDALFVRRPPVQDVIGDKLSTRILSTMAPWLEVAHVHDSDGSLHISLSPAGAAEVVRKGWGTRHRLSGKFRIPSSYTMLYAPRDDVEIARIKEIIASGVEYVSGVRRIAGVLPWNLSLDSEIMDSR